MLEKLKRLAMRDKRSEVHVRLEWGFTQLMFYGEIFELSGNCWAVEARDGMRVQFFGENVIHVGANSLTIKAD